jgi:sugar porter (SP) family MFS transporter
VIGGAMPALEKHFQMDAQQLGFAVASVFIGSIAGGLVGGKLSDLAGRKRVLFLAGLCFLVSALLCGVAKDIFQFNSGRFIGGFGIGISICLVGVYLAEIAPARMRGRIVSLNQLVITFGILVSYVVGWLFTVVGDVDWQLTYGWRWAFGVQAVPSIAFLIAITWIPESPRWLLQQGRVDEARRILSRVDGPENADLVVRELQATIHAERVALGQLITPGLRRALMVGIMLSLFDQITGINIVIYYIQKILLQLGFSESQARQGMLLLGLNNFVTTIFALLIIDRVGRKPLLIFCPLGMAISIGLVGLQFYSNAFPPLVVLLAIMAFCFFYALGPGPVNLLLLAEIFPTHVRGAAAGVSTLFMWISCYVISERFPSWLSWSEAGTFWILALMCILYALYGWIVVPETRGKSLEQIEEYWKNWLGRRWSSKEPGSS